jgi:PAS domain S-box-containing protein
MNCQDSISNPSGKTTSDQECTLRNRAEKKLLTLEDLELEVLGHQEIKRLVHELRVHQIELEIQNEDLRDAQDALEASRARLVDLYDFAPIGYVTVSETGLIVETNLTAATQLGVARKELVRQPLTRFILPEDQDIYYRHRKALFDTGAPQTCELRLLPKDYPPLWMLLKASAAKDSDTGQPVCLVIMTNITERKQAEQKLAMAYAELEVRVQERTTQLSAANADLSVEIAEQKHIEEALQESEKKYRTIADYTVDWEYWKGPSNEMLYMSPSFERITGYPRTQFMAHPNLLKLIIHPDDRQLVEDHWSNITSQEKGAMEFRIIRQDGAIRWIEHVCQPIQVANGQYKGRRVSNRDITERRQAETEKAKFDIQYQKLQRVESLGRIAGAVVHHYNNMMGIVMGNLELAMKGQAQGIDVSHNLSNSMEAVRRAGEVSGMMLAYIGHAPGHYELQDLSEICHQCLDQLRDVMPKEVDLQVNLPIPGPTVKVDAFHIQRILTNLLTNAWEASGDSRGSIHLSVKTIPSADISETHRFPLDWYPQDKFYACLEVMDNGCGISERDVDCIFDPFYTSKFSGRGLGLSVVLGLVRAHHGAITVESKAGIGSIFRVFISAVVEAVAQPKVPVTKAQEIRGGGTALVVDDEPLLIELVKILLSDLGFTVLEAKDGVEAVDVFRQHKDAISFVLCDVLMPHMDGWQTLSALRQISPGIPVILSSGYDRAQIMAGDHLELPQAFLGKPYGLKALKEAIRRVLENPEDRVT